jgi:hypothetical protein
MDNRAFRLKVKEPFPEISRFYDEECVKARENIILNPLTSDKDKEMYYRMNLGIEQNKKTNPKYRGYDGYETCYSCNQDKDKCCCGFQGSQTDDPRFGIIAKTLPKGSENPFKMIEDVSDHYGVMSFILLDTRDNRKFQKQNVEKLLQNKRIEFPAQVPMIHARRLQTMENPYDLYRYSRVWIKMQLLALPKHKQQALMRDIKGDLKTSVERAEYECRQSKYNLIKAYRDKLIEQIPSLRQEKERRKKEYDVLMGLKSMLEKQDRDTFTKLWDTSKKLLKVGFKKGQGYVAPWLFNLLLNRFGYEMPGMGWVIASGGTGLAIYHMYKNTIDQKIRDMKDWGVEKIFAK